MTRRFGGRRAPAKRAAEAFLVGAAATTVDLWLRPRPLPWPTGIATSFGLLDLDPAPGVITAIAVSLSPVGELTHTVPIPAFALAGFGFQAVAVNAQGQVVLSGRTKVEIR